jgi:hypothetical protein
MFITFLCLIFLSCAGTPAPDDEFLSFNPLDIPETTEDEDETSAPLALLPPEVMLTEPLPPEEPLPSVIVDEPEFEFAETDAAEEFPEERIEVAALPEPAIPVIEPEPAAPVAVPPPGPARPVVEPPPLPAAPVTPPPPEPARTSPPAVAEAPRPPPPVRPEIPPPPALLGPAEEKPQELKSEPVVQAAPEASAVPWVRETAPAAQKDQIVYSRTVRATVGQIVEIPFRGRGWVYLGELASRRGVAYDSSRYDPEGQSILFRAQETGTYSLKFYKQDFLQDYILNDYVQVIIGEAPVSGAGWFNPPFDRGRAVAEPRWPSTVDEAELRRGGASGAMPSLPQGSGSPAAGIISGSPQAQPPPSASAATGNPPVTAGVETQEKTLPDALLQKAKETFDQGNPQAAIALLDQYRESYPSGSDEVFWLYGQFYEASSPGRDILSALNYYRRLVREFPQSARASDARRRIAYLERYYINIQ